MALIVVDASVIVDVLAGDDSPRRKVAADRMSGEHALYAPAHLDIEVISALRGLARRSSVLAADAPALIRFLPRMPVRRMPLTEPVADRIWQLRDNLSAYDAGYVALAEQLDAALLTHDAAYTSVPGIRCAVEHLT